MVTKKGAVVGVKLLGLPLYMAIWLALFAVCYFENWDLVSLDPSERRVSSKAIGIVVVITAIVSIVFWVASSIGVIVKFKIISILPVVLFQVAIPVSVRMFTRYIPSIFTQLIATIAIWPIMIVIGFNLFAQA